MGTSPSKPEQERSDPSTSKKDDDGSTENVSEDGKLPSSVEDEDGSFVFIDKEWSCSISSAEDAVLVVDDVITSEAFAKLQNVEAVKLSEDAQPTKTKSDDLTAGDSPKTQVNHEQNINKVDTTCRRESDPVDIVPNPCSLAEEFTINLISEQSEVQNSAYCIENCTSFGKEEWIQINGRLSDSLPDSKTKFFDLYEIFSDYGNISALAATKDQIYIKFSSWAGIANVFENIKNLRQLHQFTSLQKVEDHAVKSHPDRTEIYLDLPSLVVSYLKDHIELSRAIVIITMIAKDNLCLNAPKIQQILDDLRSSVSKGFQNCTFFPYGCHMLGTWDRSEPLEIFVDTGNMYAGCHSQSDAEQTALSKEVRKLITHDVTWSTLEESPAGVFYHNTVGLKCILHFNNGFGDRCTRLLGVFMDYDERFRVLYFVLDAWSRQCSLQGISNGFNSYIVAVLLVFYLQMLPIAVLPPLERIRAGRPVFIKGWDCTFIEDARMIPRNECTTEIHSLLRGFFVFYGSYDWDRVVCPALGQSIDRHIFSHPPTQFPNDPIFASYLRAISEKVPNTPHLDISTSVCVQDFFNLSENIAKCVSSDTLLRFQSLCRQSHKMIYAAESKLSCGPHNLLCSPNLPFVQFHERNLHPERLPRHFNPNSKGGPFAAYSRCWERASCPVLQNENDYGGYGLREQFSSETNGRGKGSKNYRQRRGKNPSMLNNNEEWRINQLNGREDSRGKQVSNGDSFPRSYRGRVFLHNRNNKTNVGGK